jgi:hypothetical protein
MQRKATKPEIWATLQRLERAIPKPKGMTELAIGEYEDVLDGASFEALQAATIWLMRKAKWFPSTSDMYAAVQQFEPKAERGKQAVNQVTETDKKGPWRKPMTSLPKSNETQRLQGVEQLMNALPQQFEPEPIEAYETALKGCSSLAIQMTVNRILLKRFGWERRTMPGVDDLVRLVRDMEHILLTDPNDGPMLTKELVEGDPALTERIEELSKLTGFAPGKYWKPEPAAQPSDEERLQRLKDQANDPIEASTELLKSLANPIHKPL